MTICSPHALCHIIYALNLFFRFVMGAGLGFSTTLSTLYIMEVATPQMRSGLAVVPAVAGTLGVLYCQVNSRINLKIRLVT